MYVQTAKRTNLTLVIRYVCEPSRTATGGGNPFPSGIVVESLFRPFGEDKGERGLPDNFTL